MMKMGIRPVALPWDNVAFEPSPEGSLRVRNSAPLSPYPGRLTERLRHWAQVAADRVLLASRNGEGWRKVTYLEAFNSALVSPSHGPSSSCQAMESSTACYRSGVCMWAYRLCRCRRPTR